MNYSKPIITKKEIEERIKFFDNLKVNQEILKSFNSKPLFQGLQIRDKNKEYEMRCKLCKSYDIIMSDIFVLQRCHTCNKEYIPNVLELK